MKVKDKGLNLKIASKVIENLVVECNFDEFGARQIDKLINRKLESLIIDEMIKGNENIVIKSLTS